MESSALDIQLLDQVDEALAGEVRAFWADQGAQFTEEAARERLAALVAVGRDRNGQVRAVASAMEVRVPQLNNNLMYLYRNLVDSDWQQAGVYEALMSGFFHKANARRQESGNGPLGIYIQVPAHMIPQGPMATVFMAQDVPFYLCAHNPSAGNARVAWFDNVRITSEHSGDVIARDRVLPDGFVMEYPRANVEEPLRSEILSFWEKEGAIPAQVAQSRVGQVYLLVRDPDGAICGLLTALVKRAPLINQPVHYFRVFVAAASREHDLAATMVKELRDDLLARHGRGEVTDSVGIFTEVENEYVARYRNEAIWASTRFVFIGMNERNQQCRVIYFPGATLFDVA
ncbi:MAG: hypothetical protein P1U64_06065 [Alcanivoracaceae bacterium]|nr:hypothetical protein [Alcanivoracaceae bacterium]